VESYKQFRTFLIGFLVSGVMGLATLAWSAQASQLNHVVTEINDLKVAVERLKVLAEIQAQINERLTSAAERRP
jgi:hypothetical protein